MALHLWMVLEMARRMVRQTAPRSVLRMDTHLAQETEPQMAPWLVLPMALRSARPKEQSWGNWKGTGMESEKEDLMAHLKENPMARQTALES